jgi:pantoate--beta-alanine ligase
MRTVATIAELRVLLDAERAAGHIVGFVPTMGYLHDGHASLMRAARTETDVVLASVFVNPLQFGAGEDLDAYPRDLDRDTAVAHDAGVDLLFVPSVDEMYPRPVLTTVSVAEVSAPLEGAARPTHFAGVATVVAKLFSMVGPCRAYFGAKDFQQVAVVRRMAADLSLPVEVVACPTLREPDGLAMSSRNARLGPAERERATALRRALDAVRDAIASGVTDPTRAQAAGLAVMDEAGVPAEYLTIVDPDTLDPVERVDGRVLVVVAARVGPARLIDNDLIEQVVTSV